MALDLKRIEIKKDGQRLPLHVYIDGKLLLKKSGTGRRFAYEYKAKLAGMAAIYKAEGSCATTPTAGA